MSYIPYHRCEYLQSDGTQYIDTEYIPSINTKIEICFSVQDVNANYAIIGSRKGAYINSYTLFATTPAGSVRKIRFDTVIDNTTSLRDGYGYVVGPITQVDTQYTLVKDGLDNYINGEQLLSNGPLSSLSALQCDDTAFLFATRTYRKAECIAHAKIYYAKIWEKNSEGVYTTVRDFVPVIDTQSTPGMYDTVTQKMFYNKGGGDFVFKTIPTAKIHFKSRCSWNGVKRNVVRRII